MLLSIVIVNYKSKEYLNQCLLSIGKFLLDEQVNPEKVELIIVNNDVDSIERIDHLQNLGVIDIGSNVGYGAGNNVGAKRARGKYVMFLNPDTELVDDTLIKMIEHIQNNENIGVIGPKIVLGQDMEPQAWTCGEKSSLKQILFKRNNPKHWQSEENRQVDWVSGTALLVRRDLFEQIGGFDENIFMYFEDQDLCLRIKGLGKKVLFFPAAKILHHDGKSWDNHREKKTAYYKSQDYFFKKHHGALQTFILRIARSLVLGKHF